MSRIDDLRSAVAGSVVTPVDASYDEARELWNGMVDRRPAVLVRCAQVSDVQAAVRFAREEGFAVTVRGGGHGVAGNALSDGALVVDLSPMNAVEVDPAGRTARVQGGATLGEVDAATQAFGLATPLGVVSATGVAGLTLSGGIGWLRRKHGLSADNVVAFEVILADGSLLLAGERENDELYWALRGGGGAFGVVTAFEYRLHPVGPEVTVAFVLYPGEGTEEVLQQIDRFTQTAPEDVSPLAFLGRVPHVDAFPADRHGDPYAAVLAVYAGDAAEGEGVLAPLRDLGEPIVDLSGRMPWVEAQRVLDEDYPDGWRYYWKSAELEELGGEALRALTAAASTAPSHHSTIDVWYHGGAMSRVDADATAFGARAPYLIGVEANWEEPDEDDANVAWARGAIDALRPYSSGGAYLNFPGLFEEGEALLRASYGDRNYERLAALKRELDPDGLLPALGGVRSATAPAYTRPIPQANGR